MAIATIDYRLRVVNLTPAFSCTTWGSVGRVRQSLYTAFTAAAVLKVITSRDSWPIPLQIQPLLVCRTDTRQQQQQTLSHKVYVTIFNRAARKLVQTLVAELGDPTLSVGEEQVRVSDCERKAQMCSIATAYQSPSKSFKCENPWCMTLVHAFHQKGFVPW